MSMEMQHYTLEGEPVEESDPRAAYQINPNDSDAQKAALIESFKNIDPLRVPTIAQPAATVATATVGAEKPSEAAKIITSKVENKK